MNATTIMAAEELTRWKRMTMFVFLALPGAWLAAEGGAGLGAAFALQDSDLPALTWLIAALFLGAGSRLLLLGTRTGHQPLFLLVFLPMPILLSAGYHLSFWESPWAMPLGILGVVMPVVMYPLVSWFYRMQEEEAKPGEISAALAPSVLSQAVT